jgi:hypothetical protein
MKTTLYICSYLFITYLVTTGLTSCDKKKKPPVVVTNSSALTAGQKLEAAIDARIGTFNVFGTVDTNIYTPLSGKQVAITKSTASKIKVQAVNFTMNVFEFEVKNGTTVDASGNVFGSDNGRAIAYVGPSPFGQVIFTCDTTNNMVFSVSGTGINSVSLIGTK